MNTSMDDSDSDIEVLDESDQGSTVELFEHFCLGVEEKETLSGCVRTLRHN